MAQLDNSLLAEGNNLKVNTDNFREEMVRSQVQSAQVVGWAVGERCAGVAGAELTVPCGQWPFLCQASRGGTLGLLLGVSACTRGPAVTDDPGFRYVVSASQRRGDRSPRSL